MNMHKKYSIIFLLFVLRSTISWCAMGPSHIALLRDVMRTSRELFLSRLCLAGGDDIEGAMVLLRDMSVHLTTGLYGAKLLHGAACAGNKNIVDLLIHKGVSVDVRHEGFTPLHSAVMKNKVACVDLLLARKANPQCTAFDALDKATPLHLAATMGSTECVQKLLEYGAHIAPCDSFGHTPLFNACLQGHSAVVYALYLNVYDDFRCNFQPCLYNRVCFSDTICEALKKAEQIKTKLSRALSRVLLCPKTSPLLPFLPPKIIDLVDDYTAAKMIFEEKNKRKERLMMWCIEPEDNIDAVNAVLRKGIIDVNLHHGDPLNCAVYNGNEKIVQRLLDCQVDVTMHDEFNNTPFFYACSRNHPGLACLLRHYSADDPKACFSILPVQTRNAIHAIDILRAQALVIVTNLPAELVAIIHNYLITPVPFGHDMGETSQARIIHKPVQSKGQCCEIM